MPYIGRDAQTAQSQNKVIDDISSSFNGSTTSFALLVGGVAPTPFPVTSQNLLISVGGVIQEPDGTGTNGYQLTGANIVFSAAPASGQSFFGVILAGADYVNAGANFPDGDAGTPSITFSQDLDTGLFRSGSGTTSFTSNNNRIADFGTTEIVFNEDGDDINFRVEGDTDANLLFVDAGNDKVGIGASNPDGKLHISSGTSGDCELIIEADTDNNNEDDNPRILFRQDGGSDWSAVGNGINNSSANNALVLANSISTAGGIIFQTNNVSGYTNATERMRIDSNGLVGIGNSSPSELLTIGDTSNTDSYISVKSANNTEAGIKFYGDISGTKGVNLGYEGNGNLLFIREDDAGTLTDRFVINDSGNAGVGTSSPESRVHIRADGDELKSLINLQNRDTGSNAGSQIAFFNGPVSASDNRLAYIRSLKSGTNGNFLTFGTNPTGTAPSERMRIDVSGNVGIGTTSPDEKLHIREGDVVIGQASGNSTGIRNYIKFGREANPKAAIGFLNDNSNGRGHLIFMNDIASDGNAFSDGDEVMRIDTTRRLVLGSITPSTSVAYSVCTSGRLQTTASYTNTTGSAANMVINSSGLVIRSTSSARYKTDIETLENSYADKLLECRPVWYRSTATDDTAHPEWSYYGFIAEEVADVDPRLVHYDEQEDGTLRPEGVQYTQMIAHLVNLTKRQKQAIETLETKVAALEEAS